MCSVKLSFCDGYDFFIKNLGAYIGGDLSSYANKSYLESIQIEIDNLRKEINSYQGNANPQLKGFVSETWHTYTFNIDAARKQSTARAYQVQSNTLGSVDVSTNWGEDYSLKYYSTGENSVLAQSHSLEYAYQRYINHSTAHLLECLYDFGLVWSHRLQVAVAALRCRSYRAH